MEHRKLHEMIDACRPGSEDIDLPDMAPLADQIAADSDLRNRYQRTQQLDAQLVRAIDEIAVPAGLHERILAHLAAEAGEQGRGARGEGLGEDDDVPEAATANVAASDCGVAVAPARRRRWLFSLASVAAGLVLLVAGYAFWPRHAPLTYDSLLNLSTQWYEQLRAKPAWQPLGPEQAIRGFPLADAIRARPSHWADVSSMVGQAACAYDLPVPDGSRAALFVIAADDQIASTARPFPPGSSTGGLMIGCWQSGAFVYVLVVEGNEWNYRRLLDNAAPPLANERSPSTGAALCCKLSPAYPVD